MPAFPRVRRVRRRVEVAIVQRHGERAVAERDRAVDERSRRVRDAVGRVVVCVRVKFELDQLVQCIGTPRVARVVVVSAFGGPDLSSGYKPDTDVSDRTR